jgi:hypothetical protein
MNQNNTVVNLIHEFRKDITEKPCRHLGYCPYGNLVEQFPHGKKGDPWRCSVFGHQCPVTDAAEPFVDENGCI